VLRALTLPLASPHNPRLPRGAVDLVLLVDMFHDIDHRALWAGVAGRDAL